MVSDRGFALTVRACRQGVIDFTQARLTDVRWWQRTNILIDSMARDDDLEIIKSAQRFHLALVANSQLTEDSWKSAKTNALELFNEVVNVLHPWNARSTAQRKTEETDKLRQLYKDVIQGNYSDEEWDKVIAAEVEAMNSQTATIEKSPEDLVMDQAEALAKKQADERRRQRHGR